MSKVITDPQIIDDFINRRIDQVIPGKEELRKRLLSGGKLKLYQGFDPTSPNLHIGHVVGLLALKQFQELGHEVIFLIGDFTATIGDPSGKDKTRIPLTRKQVLDNAQTYKDQIQSVLSFSGDNPVNIQFNSEWLSKMQLEETLQLAMQFTAQQTLERDMFQERLKANKPISLHELLYPVLVTKDAMAMNVDIELGGTDQLFNMSVGRNAIKSYTQKDKLAVTVPLLTDSSGKKFGKTEGNAINITNPPEELFGQMMSLPDDTIMPCFRLITLVPSEQLDDIVRKIEDDPMGQKKQLAWEVVKMLYGEKKAGLAQHHFEKTVQKGDVPEDIPEISIQNILPSLSKEGQAKSWGGSVSLVDFLVEQKMTSSKSEARRMIQQKAVRINNQLVEDVFEQLKLEVGMVLRVGKRKWLKIIN